MVLHSNTYYTVPTASCSDAVTKKGAKVQQPLSCTQTQQKGDHRQHQTWPYYPLAELWSHGWWKHYMVNKGNYPTKESVWQWSVDYHKFYTIRQSRFHADGSHNDYGENIKQWLVKATKNDISLPLHKHLHLWLIHTVTYVKYVTNQLEFLPA